MGAHPNYPMTGNISDFNGLPIPFDLRKLFVAFLLLAILAHIIVGLLAKFKGGMKKHGNSKKYLKKIKIHWKQSRLMNFKNI